MILDDDILYSKPDPAELVLEHRGPKGWHVDDNGNWIPPVGWVDPEHRSEDFLLNIEEYKKKGLSDTDIAKKFDLTKAEFDSRKSAAINNYKLNEYKTVKNLKEKGYSNREICRKLGWDESKESNVRNYLEPGREAKLEAMKKTSDFIKSKVDEKRYVDISTKTNMSINVSENKFKAAVEDLKMQGYKVYETQITQPTNVNQKTTFRCLCSPDVTAQEFYSMDTKDIGYLNDYVSHDNGETFKKKFVFPRSLDPKRVKIRYRDEAGPDGYTGNDKDGLIEIRRGLDDLSLGKDRYAQVRILVDNDKYLKGMCAYSDDIPDGVDVVFNTNKDSSVPFEKVLKGVKKDADGNIDLTNPFGASIKPMDEGGQYYYKDKDGNEQLGLINKVRGQGEWSEWSKALPSQFLGKQPMKLIEKQLNEKYQNDLEEHQDIMNLTNPTVKKKLLKEFSDNCDTAAVHLKAAALPGQQYHVIIPINSLKENEIYAPNYENGTKLALIRYPHGGTFEIPILTVNNKHAPARKLLGDDVVDAVGITSKVAERLSGADFDGDTVMCIPTHDKAGKVKISNRPPLADLDGFDPKLAYGYDKKTVDKDGTEHYYRNGREFKHMTKRGLQTQMGVISNLITDMTLDGGATDAELAAAVKHSMVIIDSYKHHLDYKESEIANNISALHKKYQGKASGGAGTIVSRAKGQDSVVKRQGTPKVNEKGKEWYDPSKPEGSLIYKDADDAHYTYKKVNKKTGEVTTETGTRMQKTTKMANTDDAYTLVSAARNPKELAYADYANSMKALANQARLEMVHTGKIEYSSTAKNTYKKEVDSLMVKLNQAQLNTTRERAAQRMANAEIQAKQKANPNMDKSEIKKASQQALSKYRDALGSISRRDRNIDITDKEWEAIQAGAISENKLKQILDNTDVAKLRERATPRSTKSLSTSQINRIRAMSSTYTLEQIASKFNVSPSTISKYLKGGN